MINIKTATRSHDCITKDYIIPHDRIARCDYFGEFRKLANYCWCVFEFLDRYVVNKTSIKKMVDNKQKSPAILLLTGTQLNSIQPFYLDNQNMKAFCLIIKFLRNIILIINIKNTYVLSSRKTFCISGEHVIKLYLI